MRLPAILFGVILFAVAVALGVYSERGDDAFHWSPDGFIYAQMMLVDRGLSAQAAEAAVRAFYLTKPVATSGAALFSSNPPAFWKSQPALFRGRLVYPYLSSLLYPRFGFRALHWVSVASYVGAVMVMYLLLLRFAIPPLAALGTLLFASSDTVRFLSGSDSTDELAFFFWVLTIAVMIAFVASGRSWWLAAFAALTFLMVFTRPILFSSLGASLGVVVYGLVARDRKDIAAGALLSFIVVLGGIAYLAARFPGAAEQLRWHYQWQTETNQWPHTSFLAFYIHYVARALLFEVRHLFAGGLMALIVIAAIALYLYRREAWTAILVGGCLGTCIVFFVNPHDADLQRAFELPLTPALTIGFVLAAARLLKLGMPTQTLESAPT
jgi:hypothetical protein